MAEAIKSTFTHRRQRDEADSAGKLVGDFARDLQGQSRLPDPSRTGERDEPHVRAAQQLTKSGSFVFASNKSGALYGQVVGAGLGARRRHRPGDHAPQRGREPNRGRNRSAASDPWPDSAPQSKRTERGIEHSDADALRFIAKDCGRGFRIGFLLERRSAGDHLVEHRAQRKLVGTKVDFTAGRLLWRHVSDRAHHDSVLGDGGGSVRIARVAGQAASPDRNPAPWPFRRAETIRFSGFKSRWTMPISCALASASAICAAMATALRNGIGPA